MVEQNKANSRSKVTIDWWGPTITLFLRRISTRTLASLQRAHHSCERVSTTNQKRELVSRLLLRAWKNRHEETRAHKRNKETFCRNKQSSVSLFFSVVVSHCPSKSLLVLNASKAKLMVYSTTRIKSRSSTSRLKARACAVLWSALLCQPLWSVGEAVSSSSSSSPYTIVSRRRLWTGLPSCSVWCLFFPMRILLARASSALTFCVFSCGCAVLTDY